MGGQAGSPMGGGFHFGPMGAAGSGGFGPMPEGFGQMGAGGASGFPPGFHMIVEMVPGAMNMPDTAGKWFLYVPYIL